MKLRGEVDGKTFREVTAEIDAAHDQLSREHNRLASQAAMPELSDPSLAWEDLSAEDRRALTDTLIDKIVIAPHPHKIVDGRRHYLIRAIPYQDPQREAEPSRCTRRGSKSSPGSEQRGEPIAHRFVVQLSAYPITFRQTRNPCRASRDTQRI